MSDTGNVIEFPQRRVPRVQIVSATRPLLRQIAANLRESDRIEALALARSAIAGIWRSYRMSSVCRVAIVDNEPAAVWGLVVSRFGVSGLPWLMTTPAVERVKLAFFRTARSELRLMLDICPSLNGQVLAEYDQAIGFLEMLGLDIGPPAPFGKDGVMFRPFSVSRAAIAMER